MYSAVIFDLDGTLLDTLDDLWVAVNAALTKFSLPVRTREEVRSFVGNGIVKLMERATGEVEKEVFDGALAEFKRYYGEHCEDKTKPYDGIMSLLKALQAKGVQTAVVSNKADFALKKLAKSYFDGLLQYAVGENEEGGIRKKPAPDSLLAVMESMGVGTDSTVYIGDSEVDIQTAQNAGVPCISVTWGFKDKGFLIENGATLFADNAEEILSLIESC